MPKKSELKSSNVKGANSKGLKVLIACSEAYPLVKTGGLADVSSGLAQALIDSGDDCRLVLPYYAQLKAKYTQGDITPTLCFEGIVFGYDGLIRVFQSKLSSQSEVPVYLVDAPGLFDREGGLYADAYNEAWHDSAHMFATFSRVVALLACDRLNLDWFPDILHANDWQTGLALGFMRLEESYPKGVFTIHNLAYQGNFSFDEFKALHLPSEWWAMDGIEFHGQCSFLKAGLQFSDWITTVSPTYAREIQTQEYGEGMEGVLRHRASCFTGILNGVDYAQWDPGSDPYLSHNFSVLDIVSKERNKTALQETLGLPVHRNVPLFGMVCRMAYQKGVDLVLALLPSLLQRNLQVVVLGSGDVYYEAAFQKLFQEFPDRLYVHIGYDEPLAHQIEAASDFFLMPSRYEPCGLNQIYSQRYAALPIVRNTGGLSDTVTDPGIDLKQLECATGLIFDEATSEALEESIERALSLYQDPDTLNTMRLNGMRQDFSWARSSDEYRRLYLHLMSLNQTLFEPPKENVSDEHSKEIPENKTRMQSKVRAAKRVSR